MLATAKKGTKAYRLKNDIEGLINEKTGRFSHSSLKNAMDAVVKILNYAPNLNRFRGKNVEEWELFHEEGEEYGYIYHYDRKGMADRTYYLCQIGSDTDSSLLLDADLPNLLVEAITYIVYWYKHPDNGE